jgi:hypothetical protein
MITKHGTRSSNRQQQARRGDISADFEHRREFVRKIQQRARELRQREATDSSAGAAAIPMLLSDAPWKKNLA